jgi:hypothetical protein
VTFYLGSHQPGWLAKLDVPLFVSRRRLAPYRTLPRAAGPWALDSGGFSELSLYGAWTVTLPQYAAEVRRYRDEVGNMTWAASADWMCEPWIIEKTGLDVEEHQRRTIGGYLRLRDLAPDLPFLPVLQGWRLDDYLRHVEQYQAASVDLAALPLVGLGSVCRRQNTQEVERIVEALQPIRLHAFGVKLGGLERVAGLIESADSMAWSYEARRRPPLPGCSAHLNCANCPRWALRWREKVMVRVADYQPRPRQLLLFGGEGC